MNWKNLKDGKCPKDNCVGVLRNSKNPLFLKCEKEKCGFVIGKEKLKNIVSNDSRGEPKPKDEIEENLSELNNNF